MTVSEIKDIFLRLLCEQLGMNYSMYTKRVGTDKDKAIADLSEKLDSLDKYELITRAENEFNIKISDEDFQKMKTVEDVLKYVCEIKKAPAPQKTVKSVQAKVNDKKLSFMQKIKNAFIKQK